MSWQTTPFMFLIIQGGGGPGTATQTIAIHIFQQGFRDVRFGYTAAASGARDVSHGLGLSRPPDEGSGLDRYDLHERAGGKRPRFGLGRYGRSRLMLAAR